MIRILSREDVQQALPMDQAIVAMKAAFAQLSTGRANVPLRAALEVPRHNGVTLFMPGYLADDDHGTLALQEILLAGCPTVGVRTRVAFVRPGETGVVVDRLPPGRQCAESDDDVRALAGYMEAIEQAHSLDRHVVRVRAASEFDTDRIVDSVVTAVNKARLG